MSNKQQPANITYVGLVAIIMVFGLVAIGYADLDSLKIGFGGGCKQGNTGACTIKVTGSGSSLAGEQVKLQRASTARARFSNLGLRARSLDDSGKAAFRFQNRSGCYRVVTSSVRSNVICESGSGSGSSSSSSSSGNSSSSQSSGSSSSSSTSSQSSSSSSTSSSSSSSSDDNGGGGHGGGHG